MSAIERRIPDNLGGTENIFEKAPIVGTIEWTDGIVAFAPALMALLLIPRVLPQGYNWIALTISGFFLLLGLSILVLKPGYLSLSDWIRNYRAFRARPSEMKKNLQTDGGIRTSDISISDSPDTRKHTKLERIYPSENVAERSDDTIFGMIQFSGINLDTAENQQWVNSADVLSNFFNTQINYDIQFYLPMRQFDPVDYVDMYDERLGSKDLEDNLIVQEYIRERKEWTREIAASSFVREYYAVVSVSEDDVLNEQINGGSIRQQIQESPGGDLLNDIIDGLVGSDKKTYLSDSEIKDRQIRETKRRISNISSGLGHGGSNEVSIVDADKLGVLLKEYWEGVTINETEAENFIRRKPYVTTGDNL